jgi:O-antigen ligase
VAIARASQAVIWLRTTTVRRRLAGYASAWPPIAAALLGFSVPATVGVADGGVLPREWRLATLALSAIAAAALLARGRIVIARLEWGVVAALAAFAAWIAASAAWSGRPVGSILQAERAAAYVVLVLAVLLVVERTGVPYLLGGMLAGITVVSGYGLAEYLLSPPPLDPFEGRLLHRPLGYANALGIYAAIGALLSVGLALWARRAVGRTALLAPLAVLLPTLYLTSSRGAWLAFAAGLVVLASFGGRIGLPVVAALAALAAGAVVAVLIVSGGPGPLFGLAGEHRGDYWQVAWDDYLAHPLLGDGAGTFGDYWLEHGTVGFTRTAHSLYLQALAELGPVGFVLVILALGLPLVRLRARGEPLVAAAAAAYVAYVLHTGVDWDWEMPATTFAGLLSGAGLLVATRLKSGAAIRPAARAVLLVALLALAVVAAIRIGSGPSVPFAS